MKNASLCRKISEIYNLQRIQYMNDHKIDDASRREFWHKQMESARDFIQKMHEYPVAECGEIMLSVRQAVKDARLTVKFSDTKIADKYERVFYLREGLIENFLAVAREMNNRGWFLKVEDCFRTRNMQKYVAMQNCIFDTILQKVIWENNGEVPSPELMFRRLSAFIANNTKSSSHITGGAIDISVYQASNISKLELGGAYLDMSELTFMDSPFISATATENRCAIDTILKKHGFTPYPFEFWHFSQGDSYAEYSTKSGKDARYGAVHFDLQSGQVIPLDEPDKTLYSIDEIQKKMESSLKRIK